jgi:hypothetical protein
MKKRLRRFETLRNARQAAHEGALAQLESRYRSFQNQQTITILDAISTIRIHNRIATTSTEFYLSIVGVFFLLITSGSFGMMDEYSNSARYIFLSIILLLAVIIPLGLTFFFMPLHILKSMPLSLNTSAILAISSVLISLLAPPITEAITGLPAPSPFMVFVPIGGVLAVTGVALHLRNGERACYIRFKQRYPEGGLQSIIPREKQGDLHRVEAHDHYVLFVTDKGQHMHRMTMNAAMKLLPAKSGIRVHRSYWVANAQIIDMVFEQQKYTAILRNGQRVPVGKRNVEAVRALL